MINISTDINLLIKLLLKINIFDIKPGKRADRIEFKDFYTWKSIAINSKVSLKQYMSCVHGK